MNDDFLMGLFGNTALGTNLFGPPGAGRMFDDTPVPGMPMTGGKEIGLLKAGDDDMRAQAGMAPPTPLGLTKVGMENGPPMGAPRGLLAQGPSDILVGQGGSNTLAGGDTPRPMPARPITPTPPTAYGANPPPITIGAPPGVTTPKENIVAPVGGGLRPVESRAPTPPGGAAPRIDITAPTSSGQSATGAEGGVPATPVPTTTPAAAPGEQKGGFEGLMESLGKIQGGLGGAAKGGTSASPASFGGIGGAGAPHIPSGAEGIMKAIMDAAAADIPKVGAVPDLPPLLAKYWGG